MTPHVDRRLLYDSPALVLPVDGSKAWLDVAVGGNTACGLSTLNQTTGDLGLACWGANNHLQAKPVEECINYVKVLAGWDHFCGIFTRNDEPEPRKHYVRCWGDCTSGRCAVPGNPVDINVGPSASTGGFSWITVTCGSYHCCGMAEVDVEDMNLSWTKQNQTYCWGDKTYGQTQVPGALPSSSDVGANPSPSVRKFQWLAAGGFHTLGQYIDDATNNTIVVCWGDNRFGQCNLPGAPAPSVPAEPLSTELPFTFISAGGFHSCGIVEDPIQGQLIYCWGDNHYNQVSGLPGASNVSTTPGSFSSPAKLRSLSAGAFHTCAIRESTSSASRGDCVCWGANWEGQSQIPGAAISTTTQEAVFSLAYDWKSVQAGGFTTCGFAIGSNTKENLLCWGYWGWGTRHVPPLAAVAGCPSNGSSAAVTDTKSSEPLSWDYGV